MLTPSEYKERYESVSVPTGAGTLATAKINQYRLYPGTYNSTVASAFFDALKKRGIDTPLLIDMGEALDFIDPQLTQQDDAFLNRRWDPTLAGSGQPDPTESSGSLLDGRMRRGGRHRGARPLGTSRTNGPFLKPMWRGRYNADHWTKLAHLVFAGKGSPEACQVVLQLANHWGLAPDVQAYADAALGLDCNGFVGNYLWHAKNGNPWIDLGAGNHDLGPDSPIRNGYYDRYSGRLLSRWESLDTSKMYIMMEVGDDGLVINGGGTAAQAGHLVITQPNQSQDRAGTGGKMSFAVRVVESTASHSPGLWESWYTCVSYDSGTKIFVINREDMAAARRQIKFMIAAVN